MSVGPIDRVNYFLSPASLAALYPVSPIRQHHDQENTPTEKAQAKTFRNDIDTISNAPLTVAQIYNSNLVRPQLKISDSEMKTLEALIARSRYQTNHVEMWFP